MRKAQYWRSEGTSVRCLLCPHACVLAAGSTGRCRVRRNENGELVSLNYGEVSSMALDPVEKKPLYHFFPEKKCCQPGHGDATSIAVFVKTGRLPMATPGLFSLLRTNWRSLQRSKALSVLGWPTPIRSRRSGLNMCSKRRMP